MIAALLPAGAALAQGSPDWTEPFPPFRIAGNLYYVGSKGLASYLVTTPKGNILINSDLEANVPMIAASIENVTTGASIRGRYLVDVVSAASVDIVSTASRRWQETRQAGWKPTCP